MGIQTMHYDFKQKLNKIDSQKYRNLLVPEIDWKLNEAYRIFIKNVAVPRNNPQGGFETNTRSINDIRNLVVEKHKVVTSVFDNKSHVAELPKNYWFLMSSAALGEKGECLDLLTTNEVQHDDRNEESPFNSSSFEWRETNFRYFEEGLRFFTDGTFKIKEVYLNYLKTPVYMHYAEGFRSGGYKSPEGELLVGKQDCELSYDVEREIVDLAVLITTGDLQMPDYQIKMAKVKLND